MFRLFFYTALLSVVPIVTLNACSEASGTETQSPIRQGRWSLGVYVDVETGCQYVAYDGRGGVTPRLTAEGKPMCGK